MSAKGIKMVIHDNCTPIHNWNYFPEFNTVDFMINLVQFSMSDVVLSMCLGLNGVH